MTNLQKLSAVGPGMGIPDRNDYGDPDRLHEGQTLDYFIQRHNARRAGLHRDIRAGNPQLGLFSFATKKSFPQYGGKIQLHQTPIHAHAYGSYSGPLGGYGAGDVKLEQRGKLRITKMTPDAIHFSVAGQQEPDRYVLLKPKDKSRSWLLIRNRLLSTAVVEKYQ